MLSPPQRCTEVFDSPGLPSPQTAGAIVTFGAANSDCDTPEYEFWRLAPGGVWTIVQPYSANSGWTFDTAGFANGRYQIGLWAREVGSPNSYDKYVILTYYIGA